MSVPGPTPFPTSTRLLLALALASTAMGVQAQETVLPRQNVRTVYAQVLRVQPVNQTLTASRMEQRCGGQVVAPADQPRGLSRIVGAVKDALSHDKDGDKAPPARGDIARQGKDCQLVPVERQFRRPIAYDVDYVYRGMKYRSRLPYDPGNRLKIQIAITPWMPPAESQH